MKLYLEFIILHETIRTCYLETNFREEELNVEVKLCVSCLIGKDSFRVFFYADVLRNMFFFLLPSKHSGEWFFRIMYVGLYVFSWPVPLVMIEIIYILCVIVIIKSEVWTITYCLGLGHETMVPTVCLSIFLETAMVSQLKNVGNQFDNITSLNTIFRTAWNYRFKITKNCYKSRPHVQAMLYLLQLIIFIE